MISRDDKRKDFLREVDLHLLHPLFSHDLHCNMTSETSDWKISIQGNDVEDSIELYDLLIEYFDEKQVYFKVATATRFNAINIEPRNEKEAFMLKEQSKKAMTVYCPKNIEIIELCKEVKKRLITYKGFVGVSDPTSYKKYSEGIYYRNDRDEDGNYVASN